MADNFKTPDWCSGPGEKKSFVVEVLKDDEVQEVKKITKGCFFFGRNAERVDYVLNHASASRVHAVLMFNPVVDRFFLKDFGSANGSFVDKKALKPNHMEYIPFETRFSFGASTRTFRIINRTASLENPTSGGDASSTDDKVGQNFDAETERNTRLNQSISVPKKGSSLDDSDDEDAENSHRQTKIMPAHHRTVRFSESVDFINLHETDENVGQFGDMAKTTFNPRKRRLSDSEESASKVVAEEWFDA